MSSWLSGWAYRKSITLSRATGAVTNYQMKLLVGESDGATGEDVDCNSHVQTDFDDLRFTTSDGATLLDYWIESITGITPNGLATVWIKFNSIDIGATTFYMYYGRPDASVGSNGDNTFIFFDDFSGTYPGTKWTGDTTYGSVSDGIFTMAGNAGAGKTITSTVTIGAVSGAIRASLNIAALGAASALYFGFNGGHVARMVRSLTNQFDTYNGTYSIVASNWTAGSYKLVDIIVRGGVNVRWFEGGTERTGSPKTTFPVNDATMPISFLLVSSSSVTGCTCDWVLIRAYTNSGVEPAWGSWGSEELSTPKHSFANYQNPAVV